MVFGFTRQFKDLIGVSGKDPRFVRFGSKLFRNASTTIMFVVIGGLAVEMSTELLTRTTWSWFNSDVKINICFLFVEFLFKKVILFFAFLFLQSIHYQRNAHFYLILNFNHVSD
jgi:hypothetical protein